MKSDTRVVAWRFRASARATPRPSRPGRRSGSGTAYSGLPAASIGTSVMATMSENSSEKLTVRAWSRNSWPAMPVMNTIGKNTATDVSVAAVIAVPTSLVPSVAASTRERPSSRWRDDVLQHHDRVVHQHADRERDAAERHDVERQVEHVHHEEGADHRHRDREAGDEGGAGVAQEQVQDQDCQQAADQRGLAHLADRRAR